MAKSTKKTGQAASPAKHSAQKRGGDKHEEVAPALAAPSQARALVKTSSGLRVRMYRVGFGDFFLLSVPGKSGLKHILIDCGVHHADIHTIQGAVEHMANECNKHLSLVIMSHRHADHISGFGTCEEIFRQIKVDSVWMPWFEDPKNKNAAAFQASLTALAGHLGGQFKLRLKNPADRAAKEYLAMVDNITGGTGEIGGLGVAGSSANAKALKVLHGGFVSAPKPNYYKAGDTAKLPPDLVEAGLTAQILGPPGDKSLIGQLTNKTQQYLAAIVDTSTSDEKRKPFADIFKGTPDDYGDAAFELYGPDQIIRMLKQAQPDALAAQAIAADKTLNNQSLVILFSFEGKNLLFAGDAQWGNWENFLYGGAYGTPGHTELTKHAQNILENIHFYKVGHHGSTNATPKDAVKMMRMGCVGMCSTQHPAYNEVPREPLLTALRARMKDQLARSDQVAGSSEVPANPEAGKLPSAFTAPTNKLFIDYNF